MSEGVGRHVDVGLQRLLQGVVDVADVLAEVQQVLDLAVVEVGLDVHVEADCREVIVVVQVGLGLRLDFPELEVEFALGARPAGEGETGGVVGDKYLVRARPLGAGGVDAQLEVAGTAQRVELLFVDGGGLDVSHCECGFARDVQKGGLTAMVVLT